MEALWEDLSRTPAAVESPAWHKDVLDARQRQVEEGKAQYTPWPAAKAKIRRRVS
jgi:predicted metal-dependent HD superfamily phosphohydrolase